MKLNNIPHNKRKRWIMKLCSIGPVAVEAVTKALEEGKKVQAGAVLHGLSAILSVLGNLEINPKNANQVAVQPTVKDNEDFKAALASMGIALESLNGSQYGANIYRIILA